MIAPLKHAAVAAASLFPVNIRLRYLTFTIFAILTACNLSQTPAASNLPPPQQAVSQPLTCNQLIITAIETARNACNGLGRNRLCYGHTSLNAQIQGVAPPFSAPGDTLDLQSLHSLDLAPLDEPAQTFGIAILSAQTNQLTNQPGENITFALIGDADLTHLTPDMRAFTLRTAAAPACNNAPPAAMLVQAPPGTQATLTVNGATVTFDSTLFITAIPNQNLTIAALEGTAIVQSFGLSRIVQSGAQVTLPLSLAEGLLVNGQPSDPAAYGLPAIQRAPLNLLPHPVILAQPSGPTPTVDPNPTATAVPFEIQIPTAFVPCIPREDWTDRHNVESGETLFRIAEQYGLTVPELQSGNCIDNPNLIAVGQALRVPLLATPTPPATGTPTPVDFRADRSIIDPQECTIILWDVENISQIFFEGQPTTGHDAQQVCPNTTTTYTLTVIHPDGTEAQSAITIQVRAPTPTSTPTPTATPTESEPDNSF